MPARRALWAVGLCSLLVGCGFYGRRGDFSDVLDPTEPAPLFSDGSSEVLSEDLYVYRLGNGDVMTLEIAAHEEFSGTVGVDERGRVLVPNTEKVLEVAGLSLDEAEGKIAASVAPYIIGPADVRLRLLSSSSKYYYILGGVGHPGVYPMGAKVIRLREALSIAGFFREFQADKKRVAVITPDPVQPTHLITDGRAILMGLDRQNIVVKPGDVIFVQDRIIYDIDRFLYELFIVTENTASTHDAVKFWEDAIDGEFGDFTAPRRGLTVIY